MPHLVNSKQAISRTNLSRTRNLGRSRADELQKEADERQRESQKRNLEKSPFQAKTSLVRNPEFGRLSQKEQERSRLVGGFQSSRGEFLPGVTEAQKAAFGKFFVNPFTEVASKSGLSIDPSFNETRGGGGAGQGTIGPGQVDLFRSAQRVGAVNRFAKDPQSATAFRFDGRKEQEFQRDLRIEREDRRRRGLPEITLSQRISQASRDQELIISKQEESFLGEGRAAFVERRKKEILSGINFEAEIAKNQKISDQFPQDLSRESDQRTREVSLARRNLVRLKKGLPPLTFIDKVKNITSDPFGDEELFKEFEQSEEFKTGTEKGSAFRTEKTRTGEQIAEEETAADKRFRTSIAAEETEFDVDFGEELLDKFAQEDRQVKFDRAIEDEKRAITEERIKEIAKAEERAKEASTVEAGEAFLAQEMRRINKAFGSEDFKEEGEALRQRREALEIQQTRSAEDFERQKEENDIKGIIKAGRTGDTIAKRTAAEKLQFVQDFSRNDQGDPTTVVGRALKAYNSAIANDVAPKDELVFQDIDETVFSEGFDGKTTLETATGRFNGNLQKGEKYMKSRGFLESDIQQQTEAYQKDVLNYTQEEIDEGKDMKINLSEMQAVLDGTITDPLRVARILDKEKNGLTEGQKKNFVESALLSEDTDEAVKEYLRQVQPLISGPAKADKDIEFSDLDISVGEEFLTRFPNLTIQDITNGFAGEEEEKIPDGKVRKFLYKSVLEKKAAQTLPTSSFNEFKSNLDSSSREVPEEGAAAFFKKIGEFLDNRVFGGILPGGVAPGEGNVLGIVSPTGKLAGTSPEDRKGQRFLRDSPVPESITRYSNAFDVPKDLIESVIQQESGGQADVVSSAGAQGIMQLIPATAERFGVEDVFNPDDNIKGGTRYLSFLLDRYDGNEELALAAYNSGEGNIDKAIVKAGSSDWEVVRDNLVTSEANQNQTRNYVKSVIAIKNNPKLRTFVKSDTTAKAAPKDEGGGARSVLDDVFGD